MERGVGIWKIKQCYHINASTNQFPPNNEVMSTWNWLPTPFILCPVLFLPLQRMLFSNCRTDKVLMPRSNWIKNPFNYLWKWLLKDILLIDRFLSSIFSLLSCDEMNSTFTPTAPSFSSLFGSFRSRLSNSFILFIFFFRSCKDSFLFVPRWCDGSLGMNLIWSIFSSWWNVVARFSKDTECVLLFPRSFVLHRFVFSPFSFFC